MNLFKLLDKYTDDEMMINEVMPRVYLYFIVLLGVFLLSKLLGSLMG